MKHSRQKAQTPIFSFLGLILLLMICLCGLILAYSFFNAARAWSRRGLAFGEVATLCSRARASIGLPSALSFNASGTRLSTGGAGTGMGGVTSGGA